MLNISKDGTISENGAPFLWGAFMPKNQFNSLPRTVVAKEIPQPFTVELPDGSIAVGAAGDYVLLDPKTFAVTSYASKASFEAIWDVASKSVV